MTDFVERHKDGCLQELDRYSSLSFQHAEKALCLVVHVYVYGLLACHVHAERQRECI